MRKNNRLITAVVCCSLLLFQTVGLFFADTASAASGFIDPNGDGATGNWVATGGGTFYTKIDDAVRQPTAPTVPGDNITANASSGGSIFQRMSSLTSVTTVSQVDIWIYHNDGSNGQINVRLYDDNETTTRSAETAMTQSTVAAWHSVTFSSLSLTQAQLDTLSVRLRATKNGSGGAATITVYEMYAVVTYTGILSVDIVDSGDAPVSSPSFAMSTSGYLFTCDPTTTTIGDSSQRIQVTNNTATAAWNLSIAATSGATANWSSGGSTYDFNDPSGSPAGCGDGGDADALAGQLTLNPSVGTSTPGSGCTNTGISLGSSAAFNQGTTDSITLLSASSSAQTSCSWQLTGVSGSQRIPQDQAAGSYSINLTLTVVAA